MHGPICVFWANLTPFSLQRQQRQQQQAQGRAAGVGYYGAGQYAGGDYALDGRATQVG